MRIGYSDVQRGSDYMGTKIIIDCHEDSMEDRLRISALLLYLVKPYKGSWYYRCDTKRHIYVFYGYDGFLASLIEGELTGEFKSYLGQRGQLIKPRKSIEIGFKAVARRT